MDIIDGDTTLNLSGDLRAGTQGWQVALDAGLNALETRSPAGALAGERQAKDAANGLPRTSMPAR